MRHHQTSRPLQDHFLIVS